MPRKARFVAPGVPHHITQRGVRGQNVFFQEQDRESYLTWFGAKAQSLNVDVLAYCLMTNHVHHIVVPHSDNDLATLFKSVHVRYAYRINQRYGWTGHLWQERFFSSPLDEEYMWTAIRYVERNPVEAHMVEHAADYPWSSAASHCFGTFDPILTQSKSWRDVLSRQPDWFDWLSSSDSESKLNFLRNRTKRDFPCGSKEFLSGLEKLAVRSFEIKLRGRPKK